MSMSKQWKCKQRQVPERLETILENRQFQKDKLQRLGVQFKV